MTVTFKPGDRVQRQGTVSEVDERAVLVDWDETATVNRDGEEGQWLAAKAVQPIPATARDVARELRALLNSEQVKTEHRGSVVWNKVARFVEKLEQS